jgi:hypothetical protein
MRFLVLVSAAVVLAGCSLTGDDSGSVEPAQLEGLVLQQDDLANEFVQFDEGPQGIADTPGGRAADLNRFGRRGGWKARYRRPGTAETEGPLVVASLVDLFESTGGAEDELAALRDRLEESDLLWTTEAAPELGDEALAMKVSQGTGRTQAVFFLVGWREGELVASLEANGFADKLTLEDAISLAQKQAQRMSEATGA